MLTPAPRLVAVVWEANPLGRIMRDQGFEVAECRTSGEALRAVAEFLPEAVLIVTGENKGEADELSARLRSGTSTALLPVLHVSRPERAAMIRSLEYADVCIPEPVDPPVLAAAVESLVRRFRMAEQFAGRAGRLYRAIVQHLPETAVYVVDRELRCVVAEGRALETLGFSHRALEGKPVVEFDPSGPGEALAKTLTEVLAGKSVCVEAPYRGRIFFAQLVPLRNEHSEIIAAMVVANDITERKRTESALRESENRYRRLYESSPIGIISVRLNPDNTARVIAANDTWLSMTGYSREDIEAGVLDCRRLTPPEYLPASASAFAEARATGRCPVFENEHLRKDGTRVPVLSGCAALGPSADEMVSFAIDITELKRTESALRDSKDRYRQLYESSPIGVASVRLMPGSTGRIIAANDAWLAMSGYSREDLENGGVDCSRVTPPEYLPVCTAAVAEARATGRCSVFEKEHLRKDGTRIPVMLGFTTVGGHIDELVTFAIDITELKRTESALRDSKDRYRQLYESSPIGVASARLGPGDCPYVIEANDAWLAMTGYSREDLEGDGIDCRRLSVPEYLPLCLAGFAEARATGRSSIFEKECMTKDGRRLPVMLGFATMGGKADELVTFAIDITERKRLEDRLHEAQKTESIGVLAGGVAHDFNNLLTTILGNASLLAEMLPPPSPEMNRVRQIIRSSEHAADLTRQLLAYAGKGSFVTTDLDVSQALRDLLPLLRSSIPATVSLELNLNDGLPVVRADRGQLHQIVMNLVLNAAEACGDNPSAVAIRTAAREVPHDQARAKGPHVRAGSHVVVEIADDGDGIDPAILPRIFEPFFTTKFAGRGLGLAAVQGIVRRHSGFLEVESHPGQGACFRVLLPAAVAQAAAAEAADSGRE